MFYLKVGGRGPRNFLGDFSYLMIIWRWLWQGEQKTRPKRRTSCSTRRTSDFHDDDGLGEDFDVYDVSAGGDDDHDTDDDDDDHDSSDDFNLHDIDDDDDDDGPGGGERFAQQGYNCLFPTMMMMILWW